MIKSEGIKAGDMIICHSEITLGLVAGLRGSKIHAGPNRQDVAARAPFLAGTVSSQTKAWLDRMVQLAPKGVRVGVYTNLSVAQSLGSCTGYPLWIARPGGSWPASVSPWKRGPETNPFWQFDFTPRDQDAYDGTRHDLLAWLGKVPSPGPDPSPGPRPDPSPTDGEDDDMQLNTGTGAVTTIACTGGTKSFIGLLADAGQEGLNSVLLRVAVYSNSNGWSQIVDKVTIGTGKNSKQSVAFTEDDVAGVSITRISNGAADMASVSYNW